MVYTVTLNPSLDYTMTADALEYDRINRASSASLTFGGKGVNVSAVLNRLGVETTALGFAAGFTGDELIRQLEAQGVHCDFIKAESGETRINVKLRTDRELDINADGPSITERGVQAITDKLAALNDGDFIVLAGSVPSRAPQDIYSRMLGAVSGKSIKAVVDATGDALLKALKHRPFLIKPNHTELGELFGVEIGADDSELIIKYAGRLQEQGAKNVLVSCAENGAILLDGEHNIHTAKAVKGKLINSVGCGDSMVAGFIAGYIKTADYTYALKLGTACGCAAAFSPALPDRASIDRIICQMKDC